jgi:hypothetical protein
MSGSLIQKRGRCIEEPESLGIINPQNRPAKRHYKSLKQEKKKQKTCTMSTFSIQKLHNSLFLLTIFIN